MAQSTYDALIVGASFAGLAVAEGLRGRVLLIDRNEIGARQTSACVTLLSLVEEICPASVLQVYREGFVHTAHGMVKYELPEPLCAFDYEGFCRHLFLQGGAHFLKASVVGMEKGEVITDQGRIVARCVVDASGHGAVLARSLNPGFAKSDGLSFGVEVESIHRAEGLHFFVDPEIVPKGLAWLFPCDGYSRVGVASYQGAKGVGDNLRNILGQLDLDGHRPHGGFLTSKLRRGTVEDVFVVGDAAGHCLPFTGEGIRPALYFGRQLSPVLQAIINGQTSREEGLNRYQSLVESYRGVYRFLGLMQHLDSLPNSWLARLLRAPAIKPLTRHLLGRYWRSMPSSIHGSYSEREPGTAITPQALELDKMWQSEEAIWR